MQVVSDPYDIKMGDPRAGESVADYDKYVTTWQLNSRLLYFFLLYCLQLLSYNLRPTWHQHVKGKLYESKAVETIAHCHTAESIVRTSKENEK